MNEMNNDDGKMDKIYKIIKDSYHPTSEELGNYILYKNGIDPDDESFLSLAPKIEDHLKKCSNCNNLFLELNDEYSALDDFLKQDKTENTATVLNFVKPQGILSKLRYPGISLFLVLIIYLGALSLSKLVTPASIIYASLENRSDIYESRGRSTYDFQESLKALEKKDNESAVNWLNKDIVNNNSDQTIFYSYYVLGLTYLESSSNNILGLFPSYDKTKVSKGIAALYMALQKNNSGRFPNINLDICFFLGKADLMLNNSKEAKEYLIKVVNEKGSHMNEAKNILNGLD